MNRRSRNIYLGLAAGVFGALASGCGPNGTTGSYPDAEPGEGGMGTDSSVPMPDGGGSTDAGTDDAAKPEPVSGEGNVRVYGGQVAPQFLNRGPTCTVEAGSTADRWCAFLAQSATSPTNRDLFVVNVSRAAAGTPVVCGGIMPDRNCLRLTRGFFQEEGTIVPHGAFFQGDTLVFFDVFGTPYGWRPGMLDARVLAQASGGDVHDCFPASKGNAIMCLRDLPESTLQLIVSDILVGRLDSAVEPPLTRVESVISENGADPSNAQRFQYGWVTPNGDTLAWSARPTALGPETLRMRKVDDAASLRTIATDVSHWKVSADGARWYWLSKLGTVTGHLQTAALADGSGVTTMIPDVHDFTTSSSGAVVALTGTLELKSIRNPAAAPTVVTDLAIGVRGMMAVGAEHVVYLKQFDPIFPLSDAYTKRIDGTQADPCTLTRQVDGIRYGFRFLPDSSGLLWARVTSLDVPIGDLPPIDAMVTNLTTCSRTIVGSKIGDGDWDLAAANGVTYIDQADGIDGTLRLRRFASPPALDPTPATMIHTRVEAFVSVFPPPGGILFTVNAGSTKDCLYLNVATGGQMGPTSGQNDGGTASDGAPPDAGTGG
jgi:hypothetical protein